MAQSIETLNEQGKLQSVDLIDPGHSDKLQATRALLEGLGVQGDDPLDIFLMLFSGGTNELKGPVVDEGPLSESEGIRPSTADGTRNYIEWLIDAAKKSIKTLYAQEGFKDDKPPRALLYLMLRHALQLGYHETCLRLFESSGLLTANDAKEARRDD